MCPAEIPSLPLANHTISKRTSLGGSAGRCFLPRQNASDESFRLASPRARHGDACTRSLGTGPSQPIALLPSVYTLRVRLSAPRLELVDLLLPRKDDAGGDNQDTSPSARASGKSEPDFPEAAAAIQNLDAPFVIGELAAYMGSLLDHFQPFGRPVTRPPSALVQRLRRGARAASGSSPAR